MFHFLLQALKAKGSAHHYTSQLKTAYLISVAIGFFGSRLFHQKLLDGLEGMQSTDMASISKLISDIIESAAHPAHLFTASFNPCRSIDL